MQICLVDVRLGGNKVSMYILLKAASSGITPRPPQLSGTIPTLKQLGRALKT